MTGPATDIDMLTACMGVCDRCGEKGGGVEAIKWAMPEKPRPDAVALYRAYGGLQGMATERRWFLCNRCIGELVSMARRVEFRRHWHREPASQGGVPYGPDPDPR